MSMEAVLAPPQSSGEHEAYIPIDMAKQCIQKVIEDMKKMKANHYAVVEKIQEQYQLIEEESQAQFNDYVLKLRDEYNLKVQTFKHVIEFHQTDFKRKQDFYEQAIKSLRDKNRSLQLEKRNHLIKAKDDNAKHEAEKNAILSDLSAMCDKKHKDYVTVRQMYEDEKDKKESTELANKELDKQIDDLKKEIEDFKLSNSKNEEEKNTYFAQLNNLTAEKETTEKKLGDIIVQYDTLTREKGNADSNLSEKFKLIEEKDHDLNDKSQIITELESVIQELRKKPDTVHAKTSVSKLETADAVTSSIKLDTNEAQTSAVPETTDEGTSAIALATADAGVTVHPETVDTAESTLKIDTAEVTTSAIFEDEGLKQKIAQQEEIILKRENSLADLREKIGDKDKSIQQLEDELEELKKKLKDEKEKSFDSVKEERDEKNALKLEIVEVQEKNRVLHARLETLLNKVVGSDSVNVEAVQGKLGDLESEKEASEQKIEENNAKIDAWKSEFREKNDGHEPGENDRPDEINSLLLEVKASNKQLAAVEKDITVSNMLLDGKLPDDMKQGEHAAGSIDSAIEDLKKEHENELDQLKKEIDELKEENDTVTNEKNEMKSENRDLEEKIKKLEGEVAKLESSGTIVSVAAVAPVVVSTTDPDALNELNNAFAEALSRIEELEAEHTTDLEAQKKQAHKLEKKLKVQQTANEGLTEEKRELESELKVAKETAEAELKLKQDNLDEAKQELEKLQNQKLEKLPPKARSEVKALQEKLKIAEESKDAINQEFLNVNTKNTELIEQLANIDIKVKELQAKETELQKLQEVERKYKELKQKYKKLEAKKEVVKPVAAVVAAPAGGADPEEVKALKKEVAELKEASKGAAAADKKDAKGKADDGKALAKAEKANEMLKGKVEILTAAVKVDSEKIKDLEQKVKDAAAKANDRDAKKKEKTLKDLQKKLETEEAKTAKFKDNLEKEKAETTRLTAELESLQADCKKDKAEMSKLSVAAAEGLEAAEKVSELTKSNKQLNTENKELSENFNSERILRKKYYNMVEDMKGKIRVYCRARPLSRSELDRNNYNIISSPDEYTLIVQTSRGPKDFQYDAVFTSQHSQENVFEDTNRLIQSAVDGYNVCIFAYGQTGSGKTFTMIGDKEQNFPGVAPRSFKAIYALIEENKTKFTFNTSIYMMELYRDNLIDLFGNAKNPANLDIKKDKKGMVVVQGAIVHEAGSAEELMELFEKGSASRHVASTKMNAESSRSHLILSIIIESTNKTSGAVVRGKLSLVDLAGSERAAKTGATPEQLKEAQSINKSLSALGDVISALSSEQSFIPYRNNKLTMLMQDSLGGNAKTLMFVNISPAEYNADETVTSLTYASRVKLITNDASKNSDNKEIAKLKGIIAKLKKGEAVDDEDI